MHLDWLELVTSRGGNPTPTVTHTHTHTRLSTAMISSLQKVHRLLKDVTGTRGNPTLTITTHPITLLLLFSSFSSPLLLWDTVDTHTPTHTHMDFITDSKITENNSIHSRQLFPSEASIFQHFSEITYCLCASAFQFGSCNLALVQSDKAPMKTYCFHEFTSY